MKHILSTTAFLSLLSGIALADGHGNTVKIGVLMGFTGPVESLTPDMAASAELAFDEVNASGLFLGDRRIEPIRGDSTCADAAAATAAAERLVGDGVAAIVGAACSGATGAIVSNVAVPNGVLTLSPSATSPGLSDIDDRGLFFRTAPSDARQGEVLAELTKARGIDRVAVTYTNNDYGQGLVDSFTRAFKALGGTVTVSVAHEDGKADYTAEVSTLSASDASDLLVIGYVDQGGRQIIQTALDLGAFDRFILPDGMIGDALLAALGSQLEGSFGSVPGSDGDASAAFDALATEAGITGIGPFRGESYDAAALIALAMQSAGSSERDAIAGHVSRVANAPGTPIGVGELAKGLRILSEGGDIDYVGVSNVELDEGGNASGSYREIEIKGAAFETQRVW
ncbi:ABC transporter substrate-binding protein [Aliiroseovarius sp. S2029]|uniref:ABC transporter substrate-binding protein n=1 Tax=Aliiroseovarius sp. S2029 TaxID=2936988 RepID=UPI0020BF794E|nr:ABC transporter substrate-binding protein [Aliiroseovarius sp. S2029]MCK8484208.1 ABC transporter substrate-binding protein [Aliiroseovarius sp. S2029]